MRIIFLPICCILLSCIQGLGQYIPLSDTNNLWSIQNKYSAGPIPPHSHYIKLGADTLINSKLYRMVLTTTDTLPNPSWTRAGYLHEDTVSECVYFMNNNYYEGQLYNFLLIKGDTVTIVNANFPYNSSICWVTDTDSISIGNQFRKRLHISSTSIWYDTVSEVWIEGVGSDLGLIYSNFHVLGALMELLCLYNEDGLVYQNPNFQSCFYPLGIELLPSRDTFITIWPNPITNNSELYFRLHESYKSKAIDAKIYTPAGHLVKSLINVKDKIRIENIPPGIYIIRLCNNEFIYTHSMIVYR